MLLRYPDHSAYLNMPPPLSAQIRSDIEAYIRRGETSKQIHDRTLISIRQINRMRIMPLPLAPPLNPSLDPPYCPLAGEETGSAMNERKIGGMINLLGRLRLFGWVFSNNSDPSSG